MLVPFLVSVSVSPTTLPGKAESYVYAVFRVLSPYAVLVLAIFFLSPESTLAVTSAFAVPAYCVTFVGIK